MSGAIMFCIGLFIGSIIGAILTALCSASGNSERERYIQKLKAERDRAINKMDFIDELYIDEERDGKLKTNADRIRSMTDEELVVVLNDPLSLFSCENCEARPFNGSCSCIACESNSLKWLKSEVKESEEE